MESGVLILDLSYLYFQVIRFIHLPLLLETEHWSTNNINTNPRTKEIPIRVWMSADDVCSSRAIATSFFVVEASAETNTVNITITIELVI